MTEQKIHDIYKTLLAFDNYMAGNRSIVGENSESYGKKIELCIKEKKPIPSEFVINYNKKLKVINIDEILIEHKKKFVDHKIWTDRIEAMQQGKTLIYYSQHNDDEDLVNEVRQILSLILL